VFYIKLLVRAKESALTVVRNAHIEEKWLFTFLFTNRVIIWKEITEYIHCDRCIKFHFKVFLFQPSELTELQGLNKKLIKIPHHCNERTASLHFSHKLSTGHYYEPGERVCTRTHCSFKVHLNITSLQHRLWRGAPLQTLSLFHTSLRSNPNHNAWFNRSNNICEILPLWITSSCSLLPIT
jgi:hypothetical protein